jgi:hypothetical protein
MALGEIDRGRSAADGRGKKFPRAGDRARGQAQKNPTAAGLQKLDNYFIRKFRNVNPPREKFLKNLPALHFRGGLMGSGSM